ASGFRSYMSMWLAPPPSQKKMIAVSLGDLPASAAAALSLRWSAIVRPARPRAPTRRKPRRVTPSQPRLRGPSTSSIGGPLSGRVRVCGPERSVVEEEFSAIEQRPGHVFQPPARLLVPSDVLDGDGLLLVGRAAGEGGEVELLDRRLQRHLLLDQARHAPPVAGDLLVHVARVRQVEDLLEVRP